MTTHRQAMSTLTEREVAAYNAAHRSYHYAMREMRAIGSRPALQAKATEAQATMRGIEQMGAERYERTVAA